MEVLDEKIFQKLADNQVCRRWWLFMTSFLECESAPTDKAREEMLTEIFHLK
ncbi:MAG: L-rhamnose mutarotase [Sphingobacteriales bacterium]|nr:L-rhamnose mutarotase [Sphingobacteriales bacterium]